jgi:hypothetical protein
MLPAHQNESTAREVPRRRFSKRRIAWSVGWGIVAVLLVVLWIRSSYHKDRAFGTLRKKYAVEIASVQSGLGVLISRPSGQLPANWRFDSFAINEDEELNQWAPPRTIPGQLRLSAIGFFWYSVPAKLNAAVVPHWFLVLLFTTFAALPWIAWSNRFTLRTLLIATTLVAVGLGAIVYAVR